MLTGLMLISAVLANAPANAPPNADDALGVWQAQTRNAVVDIEPCGGSICGRVVTSDLLRENPTITDRNNPDPAERQRLIKGLLMLSGFTAEAADWHGGVIYNADDGRTYHARLTPLDHDHLRVRGCVFVPLCKTQLWVRVAEPGGKL